MVITKNNVQLEGHKLMYHPNEVSKWMKGDRVAPIYVEIGPINSCNHKCVFCALDYLKTKGKMISKDVMFKTLDNMGKFGVKSIMFAGEGEPLVYPFIVESVQKAKDSGLDISITTNGIFFDEKKINLMLKNLSWIKFSIDAGTKKTYAKIHGCKEEDFDKILANIKYASEFRKKNKIDVTLGTQMLMIPDNISEVEELIIKVKENGADYLVLKPYSQHPNSVNKMVLDIKKYENNLLELVKKYSSDNFQVIFRSSSLQEIEQKEISYDICYGINFFALIDATGNVIPCNLFYENQDFYYGNINDNNFEEIWQSDKRKKVVDKIYKKGCKDCRKGCRLNFVNKYLDTLKNKKIKHMNFI